MAPDEPLSDASAPGEKLAAARNGPRDKALRLASGEDTRERAARRDAAAVVCPAPARGCAIFDTPRPVLRASQRPL